MTVITISRQFGSGGEAIAGWWPIKWVTFWSTKNDGRKFAFMRDRDDFEQFDEKFFATLIMPAFEKPRKRRRYLETMHNFIYDLAMRENLVLLGRGGQVLFKDFLPALHVKVIAPLKCRLDSVCKSYGLDEAGAARLIEEQDQDRQEYLRQIFGYNWLDLDLYHLVVNTGILGLEEAVDLVVNAARNKSKTADFPVLSLNDSSQEQGLLNSQVQDATGNAPSFAHPSEEEFARMLDFYQIKWLYEPKTFPLEWDSEGNITVAFSPDFYLPEQDL